ncbi:hypothetical protein BOX15_Mlig013493g1 [Macrostomum lignano]|uniref:Netrin receptor UNC5 n=2 Tax=Macrostomum lignano TaxID=282301 RepID=A0A267FPA8_9PLAT|nr:hypothetical protein BOX15_Mlig013493g1 [Macrostomum lignano]
MWLDNCLLISSLLIISVLPASALSLAVTKLTGNQVPELSDSEKHLPLAPRLIQQPKSAYYVSPKSPAVIECVADHSSYVTIHCNGQALNRRVDVVTDHERAERQRFSVPIDFEDAQRWLGADRRLFCNCEAWNSVPELNNTHRKVVSSPGYVRLAYFESQRFQFDPVPQNVSIDANSVMLSCTPPVAHPKPKVHWMKDGQPLDIARYNDRVTVDHQAQLIIRPLMLEDRGNYSCVAQIPGQSLASKTAQLAIYVNGGWSPWTIWRACDPRCETVGPTGRDQCPSECSEQRRERRRQCNNPRPQYGGRPCVGEARTAEMCDAKCIVHGKWGEWSPWSYCGPDCRSSRQRACNSPSPRNGGFPCADADSGENGGRTRNCSDGLCRKEDQTLLRYINGQNGRSVNPEHVPNLNNVAIYIGLFVAAAVIVTVAVVIVYLVRKKSVSFTAGRRVPRYNIHMNELLLPPESATPAKSGSAAATAIEMCSQQLLPHQSQHQQHQQQRHFQHQFQHQLQYKSPVQSEQGLRVQLPMSSTYQSIGRPQLMSSCCPASPGDCKPSRPCSALYHELSLGSHVMASFVPANVCVDQLAWGSIGPEGGRLCLTESGVALTVPANAIGPQGPDEVFLAACRDPGLGPVLADKQTLLSPVVACGPSSLATLKPAVLSLPHAACLRHGFWSVSVLYCDDSSSSIGGNSELRPPAGGASSAADTADPEDTVDENDVDELDDCNDGNETGERCPATEQKQKVSGSRCLTYEGSYLRRQPSQQSHQHQQLWRELDATTAPRHLDPGVCHLLAPRLGRYCLIGQSQEGGNAVKLLRLAAFAASPMQSSAEFCLRLHVLPDTPDALELALLTEEQEAGARLVDSPRQLAFRDGGQQLCFSIEELSLGWRSKSKYQEIPFAHVWSGGQAGLHCAFGLEHVDPTRQSVSCKIVVYQNHYYNSRQVVHIVSSKNDLPGSNPLCPSTSMLASSRVGIHADPPQTVFRLPPRLRGAICRLLDAPSCRGSDWRMLGRLLGMERLAGQLAGRPSPTDCLLDLWEARCRGEEALIELADSLKAMGRQDAACLLEQEPDSWL